MTHQRAAGSPPRISPSVALIWQERQRETLSSSPAAKEEKDCRQWWTFMMQQRANGSPPPTSLKLALIWQEREQEALSSSLAATLENCWT
jgi:hypothetical protein